VSAVEERGGALEIEVELSIAAAVYAHFDRGTVEVKERPVVWVRDLPISGRWSWLRWRKRRFACQACGRTFTESHPEIPPRQRSARRARRAAFVTLEPRLVLAGRASRADGLGRYSGRSMRRASSRWSSARSARVSRPKNCRAWASTASSARACALRPAAVSRRRGPATRPGRIRRSGPRRVPPGLHDPIQ
jgi:transposase